MHIAELSAKHTAQLSVMQGAYAWSVETVQEKPALRPYRVARRARLADLVEEAGSAANLARLSGTPKSHISAMLAGDRGVGDDLAEKLERLMDKPTGWMDEHHFRSLKLSLAPGEEPPPSLAPFAQATTYAPARQISVAAATRELALALSTLPATRRKTLAGLIASQISDGETVADELLAIDALSGGITLPVEESAPWRQTAFNLAEKHPDPKERERLVAFVHQLIRFINEQAVADRNRRAHGARDLSIKEGGK